MISPGESPGAFPQNIPPNIGKMLLRCNLSTPSLCMSRVSNAPVPRKLSRPRKIQGASAAAASVSASVKAGSSKGKAKAQVGAKKTTHVADRKGETKKVDDGATAETKAEAVKDKKEEGRECPGLDERGKRANISGYDQEGNFRLSMVICSTLPIVNGPLFLLADFSYYTVLFPCFGKQSIEN